MNMTQDEISNELLNAFEIIADRKIQTAGFDRTIQATITAIEDETIGEYKVRYQDASFKVYSLDTAVKYTVGTEVYVHIPVNDTGKTKTILGTVKRLGTNYNTIDNELNKYFTHQPPIVDKSSENVEDFYVGTGESLLEKYDGVDTDNFIQLLIKEKCQYIMIDATFDRNWTITPESGIYGIRVSLTYERDKTSSPLSGRWGSDGKFYQDYICSSENMIGNPYSSGKGHIYAIYKLDENIRFGVNAIFFQSDNIAELNGISNLNVKVYALDLREEDSNKYSLNILTPQGTVLNSQMYSGSVYSSLTLKPYFKVDGALINNFSNYNLFWFKKDSRINATSSDYSKYGGGSWKLLASAEEYIVNTEGNYKLVVVDKQGYSISSIVNIKDASKYVKIKIESQTNSFSDRGIETQITLMPQHIFYHFDTATAIGIYESNFEDSEWSASNSDFTWSFYSNSTGFISEEELFKNNQIWNKDKNKISVKLNEKISSYSCYAIIRDNNGELLYEGETSETFITDNNQGYTFELENDRQSFLYDYNGISPVKRVEEPQSILPIYFHIYDNGKEIEDYSDKVEVTITNNSSLLEIVENYNNVVYFSIADRYVSNDLGNFHIKVTYRGETFESDTNFIFAKEGENGTNGTSSYLTILTADGDVPYLEASTDYNTTSKKTQVKLKAVLCEDGVQSFPSTGTNWSVHSFNGESTPLISLYGTGKGYNQARFNLINVTYGSQLASRSAIAKVEGINSDNKTLYAYLPIMVGFSKNSKILYRSMSMIPKKGYYKSVIYNSEGLRPKYDNEKAFWYIEGEGIKVYSHPGFKLVNYTENAYDSENDKYYTSFYLQPEKTYPSDSTCNGVLLENDEGWLWCPVYMGIDRYGNENLNGWDGNTIQIDNNGGYILAPQIGAGKKESDNTFTGLVMGIEKLRNGTTHNGLLGYSHGERSIFLDAETGKAEFGKTSLGKIIIDPSNKTMQITSANYDGSSGLLIDLTDSFVRSGNYKTGTSGAGMTINFKDNLGIHYGNGKFDLNSAGYLTSTSGKIGCWNIGTNSIFTDKVRLDESGISFYDDNKKLIGSFETTFEKADSSSKGIAMHLDPGGNFISWSAKTSSSDESYIAQLVWAAKQTATWKKGLTLLCDLNTNGKLHLSEGIQIVALDGDSEKNAMFIGAKVLFGEPVDASTYTTNAWVDCSTGNASFNEITVNNIINNSDERKKINISDTKVKALEVINKINLKEFDWKIDGKHQEIGIIAQELKEICPELVAKDSDGFYGIESNKLIYYLIKAIQELQKGDYKNNDET